jgi:hypothetical protein
VKTQDGFQYSPLLNQLNAIHSSDPLSVSSFFHIFFHLPLDLQNGVSSLVFQKKGSVSKIRAPVLPSYSLNHRKSMPSDEL